jgi:hypothetical protein
MHPEAGLIFRPQNRVRDYGKMYNERTIHALNELTVEKAAQMDETPDYSKPTPLELEMLEVFLRVMRRAVFEVKPDLLSDKMKSQMKSQLALLKPTWNKFRTLARAHPHLEA